MELNWIVSIILFGILQSVFFLFIFKNKGKKYRYFNLFLIVLIIIQTEPFLIRSGLIKHVIHLFKVSTPFGFLLGPLLYLYIVSEFGKQLSKRIWLHGLPFIGYFVYSFNFFLQSGELKHNIIAGDFHPDWTLLEVTGSFPADPWQIQGWVVVEALTLHILLYCVLCFYTLLKAKNANAAVSADTLKWLLYSTAILTLGTLVLFFSQGGIINGAVFLKTPFPHYAADLFSSIAIYLLMIYLLVKPGLLTHKDKKYSKSSLSGSYKKEKLRKIKTIIEADKLYLDPDFSMRLLSEKSGLSIHHISQILNEELQCSFFQLTNNYRIDEAKERLRTDNYIKMEQLAYDLGYKSKSTFFSAFKKATRATPLQYKTNSV